MNKVLFFALSLCLSACSSQVGFLALEQEAAIQLPSARPEPAPQPKTAPGLKLEFFTLAADKKKAVDFLIVEDSSASMNHHLARLGGALSSLLSIISDYEWQLAFTTADHGDHKFFGKNREQDTWEADDSSPKKRPGAFGRLMPLEKEDTIDYENRILNKNSPNYEQIFLLTASHTPKRRCSRPPYCQKFMEQPLRSLKSAIERASAGGQELFRSEADFVSLIISNEDERREDQDRATRAKDVIAAFNKQFGHLEKKFIAYNILIMDDECLEKEAFKSNTDVAKGEIISELADLTGGGNISLCSEDYEAGLRAISLHIKNSLEKSIMLSEEPDPETIKVAFEKKAEALPWSIYGKTIVFKGEIQKDEKVQISYKPLSKENKKSAK